MGKQMGNAQLKDIVIHGEIMTKQDLIRKHGWSYLKEWEYLQIKHFVNTPSTN